MPLMVLGYWYSVLGALALFADAGAGAPVRQPRDGATVYAATCAACHQANGTGMAEKFPPLIGTEWVLGNEDRLVRIVLHGLTGDIEVEGETFNGLMPTWGPLLTDGEVAAVATYVRTSWGNKAPPVKAATVTRLRAAHAERFTPWTAAELQQLMKSR